MFHMHFVYSRKKSNDKKGKKYQNHTIYLSYFLFWACNQQCCTQTYFHTVESVLVTNMKKKYFLIIKAGSPRLYRKGWELEFCLFFKKWGKVHFSPKKGEVGKIVEEWRLVREKNLCLLANLCVCKSKKHYNPRYIYIKVISFVIYLNFWDKVLSKI